VVGSNRNVTRGDQTESATKRVSVDSSDDRLRTSTHGTHQIGERTPAPVIGKGSVDEAT
jgi:hypothetical protein